jgi:pyruvate,water dikinase
MAHEPQPAEALNPACPEEARALPRDAIGGKAAGLLQLHDAELAVPPWRVWTAAQTVALSVLSDEALGDRLRPLFAMLDQGGGVIFRSSAASEDGVLASAAGVYDSVRARSADECAAAFRKSAESADAEHVGAYHRQHGRAHARAIPVIVQAFVVADISGVAFSGHPARCRPDAMYLECVCGGAAGLVSGAHDPLKLSLDWESLNAIQEHAGTEGPGALPETLPAALRDALLALEGVLRGGVDAEWCFADGRLWMLQARPITGLRLAQELMPDERCTSWFFDQRFPAPITPFTRSTLLPLVADIALGDALRMRGDAVPAGMLVFHAGRAYAPRRLYDLMLRGAPRWWLSDDLRQIFKPEGRPPDGLGATLHYAVCAVRGVWRERRDVLFNLGAWRGFCAELDAALSEDDACDSPEALENAWHRWDAYSARFLRIHRWSILWADYAFRAASLLSRRLPVALTEAARIKTAEANAALAALLRQPDAAGREAFTQVYGHRSGSLDYAAPTWSELLRDGALKPSGAAPVVRQVPHPCLRALWPASVAVRLLELREEQRFRWEQILARQRTLVLHWAGQLVRERILPSVDDVWFCTWDELMAAAREGHAIDRAALVRRRHEHWLYHAALPPQVLGGSTLEPPETRTTLVGLGGSPGIGEGPAMLCRYPEDIPANATGRVLVVGSLDPAWTARVAGAAALIVERGGILSHAAIIAREYGLPLVIGVDDALSRVVPGERLRVDGTTGTIHRLDP